MTEENTHWAEGFEHSAVTTENREAFNKAAIKFPTQGDMCVGYMEQSKLVGQPFKLPESMDKLPDDASRSDFTAQVNKLQGREFAVDVAGLIDLDMKAGSTAEGEMYDEALGNRFKQFVVNEKIDKAKAQAMVKFHNTIMGEARTTFAEKATTDHAAAARACNDVLVAHADFGTQDKLDVQTTRLHRALLSKTGLTAEEAENVSKFFKEGEGATNPVLRRVMLNALAPLATEATTESGKGGTAGPKVKTTAQQLPKTAAAMGWK